MKTRRDANGLWIVHLERGESVRKSVEAFARDEGIAGARITAVGALENPELACYDLPEQKYYTKVFDGIWELLTADGNITLKDGKAFMHMHVAISGHDFVVYGGHLVDAPVGVVTEMFIDPLAAPLERGWCEAVGLPVWQP